MSFEERTTAAGVALSLIAFVTYCTLVLVRAATDDLQFTHVSWQKPMLWTVIIGGGFYAALLGAMRWRMRGQRLTDERDTHVRMRAESTGAGLTSLAVIATLIMLATNVETFWVAHVLFVGTFLGSLAQSGTALATYREGL